MLIDVLHLVCSTAIRIGPVGVWLCRRTLGRRRTLRSCAHSRTVCASAAGCRAFRLSAEHAPSSFVVVSPECWGLLCTAASSQVRAGAAVSAARNGAVVRRTRVCRQPCMAVRGIASRLGARAPPPSLAVCAKSSGQSSPVQVGRRRFTSLGRPSLRAPAKFGLHPKLTGRARFKGAYDMGRCSRAAALPRGAPRIAFS